LLIRVETEWHLIDKGDNVKWQHLSIEKNLLSINGETLNYTYIPPPVDTDTDTDTDIDPDSGFNWILPISILGIVGVGVGVIVVILGKKRKKM